MPPTIPCKKISIPSTQRIVNGSRSQTIIRKRIRNPAHVPKHQGQLNKVHQRECSGNAFCSLTNNFDFVTIIAIPKVARQKNNRYNIRQRYTIPFKNQFFLWLLFVLRSFCRYCYIFGVKQRITFLI